MPGVKYSRYEFAPVEEDEEGRKFLDVPDPLTRAHFPDDDQVVVGQGDTLHTVAWHAFEPMLDPERDIGPSRFYWVIAQINDKVDATEPLVPGETLRTPSIQTLVGDLLVPPPFFERDAEE